LVLGFFLPPNTTEEAFIQEDCICSKLKHDTKEDYITFKRAVTCLIISKKYAILKNEAFQGRQIPTAAQTSIAVLPTFHKTGREHSLLPSLFLNPRKHRKETMTLATGSLYKSHAHHHKNTTDTNSRERTRTIVWPADQKSFVFYHNKS